MQRTLILLTAVAFIAACTGKDAESRAREAEKKIKDSIPDIVGAALAQKASPEQIKLAQEDLKAISEYLGDANGKLDAVTVSAIQAFQRTQGMNADGMLNAKTMRRLQEAAAKAQAKQPS
jgi:peptidoglycan hydrolase-like protein with peptidoglycan-binding domain